jgi:multicomponent Na+:H+ antiporter subunit B
LKIIGLIVVIFTGAVLAYGTLDMPEWGDPDSPASTYVSPHYLTHSQEETATPNVVTAVLGDYRGYDTMGETTVIFAAGMACLLILTRKKEE